MEIYLPEIIFICNISAHSMLYKVICLDGETLKRRKKKSIFNWLILVIITILWPLSFIYTDTVLTCIFGKVHLDIRWKVCRNFCCNFGVQLCMVKSLHRILPFPFFVINDVVIDRIITRHKRMEVLSVKVYVAMIDIHLFASMATCIFLPISEFIKSSVLLLLCPEVQVCLFCSYTRSKDTALFHTLACGTCIICTP